MCRNLFIRDGINKNYTEKYLKVIFNVEEDLWLIPITRTDIPRRGLIYRVHTENHKQSLPRFTVIPTTDSGSVNKEKVLLSSSREDVLCPINGTVDIERFMLQSVYSSNITLPFYKTMEIEVEYFSKKPYVVHISRPQKDELVLLLRCSYNYRTSCGIILKYINDEWNAIMLTAFKLPFYIPVLVNGKRVYDWSKKPKGKLTVDKRTIRKINNARNIGDIINTILTQRQKGFKLRRTVKFEGNNTMFTMTWNRSKQKSKRG